MNRLKKVIASTLCVYCSGQIWASANQVDIYCHDDGLEYRESISVGKGVHINLNQGSYSYVPEKVAIEPSYDFIQQQLVKVGGVRPECAEFLMTKGDKAFSEDGVMARVHFAFDSSELTKQSRYILDTLLERLQSSSKVVIEGHTDSVGEKQYNFTLGAERAVAVANYISQHSDASYDLVKISKGETAPIADNSDEQGRYLNRRVDIK